MGHIDRFNLRTWMRRFGFNVFVETGTGWASSLLHASRHPFAKLYSSEIEPYLADESRKVMDHDQRVRIDNCTSREGIERAVGGLAPGDRCLFFLDAHFPGEDFGLKRYEDTPEDRLRIPLEDEVALIARLRRGKRDVIIADDLWIYEDGPFEYGNWEHRSAFGGDGIPFVYEHLGDSHHVLKDYRDGGYIIALPR